MNPNPLDSRIEHPIRHSLVRCPACGSDRLDPVVENVVREVHFLCGECDRCWNVEMRYVQRVAPSACLGCPERARCERADAAERDVIDG